MWLVNLNYKKHRCLLHCGTTILYLGDFNCIIELSHIGLGECLNVSLAIRRRILTQLKDLKLIERMGIDEKQDIVK